MILLLFIIFLTAKLVWFILFIAVMWTLILITISSFIEAVQNILLWVRILNWPILLFHVWTVHRVAVFIHWSRDCVLLNAIAEHVILIDMVWFDLFLWFILWFIFFLAQWAWWTFISILSGDFFLILVRNWPNYFSRSCIAVDLENSLNFAHQFHDCDSLLKFGDHLFGNVSQLLDNMGRISFEIFL